MTWTASIATSLGVAEEGLRLILGQLSGYPLFLFHQHFLRKSPPVVQHAFFAITGMAIAYWSIGLDCLIHSTTCVAVTWAVLNIFKGSANSTIFMYIFHMGYLCTGYYLRQTSGYDINWTMPGCVLCLRLIGLSVDIHDGRKKKEELSKDQQEAALTEIPSILEMFSHSFFVGGFFVGPQFSMKKFQNYIQRNINEDISSPNMFALKRLGLGCSYLLFHLIGDMYFPTDYVQTPEFDELNYFKKSIVFALWVKIILAKYISVWLMAEGTCILAGLAYNGRCEDGSAKWNGVANVKLRIFEKSSRFQHLIDSFNINTNAWVMSYVYKRLRFLNNRLASQFGALVFLALWHGWHSGYYVCFLLHEFLVINFEKGLFPMLDNSPIIQRLNENPLMKGTFWLIGKMYLTFFLPHCFAPFAMLKWYKYIPVMKSTLPMILICFGTWPIWSHVAKMILQPQKPEKKKET